MTSISATKSFAAIGANWRLRKSYEVESLLLIFAWGAAYSSYYLEPTKDCKIIAESDPNMSYEDNIYQHCRYLRKYGGKSAPNAYIVGMSDFCVFYFLRYSQYCILI